MKTTTVDRRWLQSRLLEIESMGIHMGRALRELIEELDDARAFEPEIVELERRPFWKRALVWRPRRGPRNARR